MAEGSDEGPVENTPPERPGAAPSLFPLGLVIGAIPLAIELVDEYRYINPAGSPGSAALITPLLIGGALLYVAELFLMLWLIEAPPTRRVGQGMLMILSVSPVIYCVSCQVRA